MNIQNARLETCHFVSSLCNGASKEQGGRKGAQLAPGARDKAGFGLSLAGERQLPKGGHQKFLKGQTVPYADTIWHTK